VENIAFDILDKTVSYRKQIAHQHPSRSNGMRISREVSFWLWVGSVVDP